MAYSTSPKTVEKMQPKLRALEQGKPCSWQVKPQDLQFEVYKIREALYAANANAKRFPLLARAYQVFTVRAHPPDRITAYLKRNAELVPIEHVEESSVGKAGERIVEVVPLQRDLPLEESADELIPLEVDVIDSIDGPQSHFTVLEAWSAKQGKVRALHFPEAELSVDQLLRLYRWAKLQQPELMLMTEPPEPGLTLSRIDPEVEEYQWRPDSES